MGYKQKYYTFGSKPYVYDWRGSAMQPSKTNNQGLGADDSQLMQTKVKDSGTRTSTDPRFVPIVMGAQQKLNKFGVGLTENGQLNDKTVAALQAYVPVNMAVMTWAQVYSQLDSRIAAQPYGSPQGEPSGSSRKMFLLLGGGALLIYLLTRKR